MVIMLSIIGVVVILVLYLVVIYNSLVGLKNRFVNAFSQIDVQLQRRYDLIPNLVETAKTYMKYEQETLNKIVEARNHAKAAESTVAATPENKAAMEKLVTAEKTLTASMGSFFALVENYPDLKANQTMQQLMEELTSTENKVGFSRQAFNDAVMYYNTYREKFPNMFVANSFHFLPATHFEVSEPEAKKAVKVSF